MKDVYVMDDYLECDTFKNLCDYVRKLDWSLSNKSQVPDYGPAVNFWFGAINDENYDNLRVILEHITKKVNEQFNKTFEITQARFNGQTYGQNGLYHQDNFKEDEYTFVIYTSEFPGKTLEEVGGFFEVIVDDNIIIVKPKLNRVVFFRSKLFHRGMAPNLTNGYMRTSLAIKYRLVKDYVK